MIDDERRSNLEEARKHGLLTQFAKDHPSKGDRDLFERLLEAMAKPKSSPEADQT
jgi:hypothetical protein